jgi:GNAT superfamily N-acetyltransferase
VTSAARFGLTGRAEVSVRPARAEDAEAIARVQLVTWRTAYRSLLPAAVLDEWDEPAAVSAWRDAVVSPPTPGHRVLVALDGAVVAGFAAFGPAEGTKGDPPRPDGPTAELSALLVEPRWGRRGHGSRLLAAVADIARESGIGQLVTWLPEDDGVTARFLTATGWAADGWVRSLDTGSSTIRQARWHTVLGEDDDRGVQ